jgi:pimeloyl-ACP methyl ester carboxylesterase
MRSLLAVAAGLAVGVAAEQVVVRQPWRPDPWKDEAFGSVRGEPHWLRASDGTQLYVEVQPADSPDAPTIVFSHGYCLSQDSWHFQRKALAGRARIVAWDQRGHGRSERGPVGNNSIDQLGRDLQWVLDAFADGPVTLVGHSMGGMTVMALADQFPETVVERVTGVGFVATSAGDLSERFIGLSQGMSVRFRGAVSDPRVSKVVAVPWMQRARYSDANFIITKRASFGSKAPNSLNRFTLQLLNATPMVTVLDFLPTLMDHDKHHSLKAFRDIPAYVVVGDADVLTPPPHMRRIFEQLPHADAAVLPDTGHMIQLERADEVTAGISRLAFGDHAP